MSCDSAQRAELQYRKRDRAGCAVLKGAQGPLAQPALPGTVSTVGCQRVRGPGSRSKVDCLRPRLPGAFYPGSLKRSVGALWPALRYGTDSSQSASGLFGDIPFLPANAE